MLPRAYRWSFSAGVRAKYGRVIAESELGVLSVGSFFLLIFSLPPTGIGIVFLHGFGVVISLLAEILLIHGSILANDECHHAGRPICRRIGHESKTAHFAVSDIVLGAAWRIFSLARQDVIKITAVRGGGVIPPGRITLRDSRRHQRPYGAQGFSIRGFPIETIVLPCITKYFLG